MKNLKELLKEYICLERINLVNIASKNIIEIKPICKEYDKKSDGNALIGGIILSCVASDGKLSFKERNFIKLLLDYTDEDVDYMITHYTKLWQDVVNAFIDGLNVETKQKVVELALAIIAVDNDINKKETEFLKNLIK